MNTCIFLVVLCFAYCSAGGNMFYPHRKAPVVEEVVAPAYGAPVYDDVAYGAPLVEEVVDPGYGYRGAPLVEELVAPGYKYGAPLLTAGYGAPMVSGGYGAPLLSEGYGYGAPILSEGYGAGYGAPVVSAGYGAPIASAGYGAPVVSAGYGAPVVSAPVVEEILEPVSNLHRHKQIKEEAYDHEHDSAYRFTANDAVHDMASYYPGASIVAGAPYYPAAYPHYPKHGVMAPMVGGYPRY